MSREAPLKLARTGEDRPGLEEAAEAVRVLLRWSGEDPAREGLLDTPQRVLRAFEEMCSGYRQDPAGILDRTFDETAGYDDLVLLKDIPFESLCEHHLLPFTGTAHVAYLPDKRVVGLSKLARLVDAYARRMQLQERLTAQIAATLDEVLAPRGVAVVIQAEHQCMSCRGARKGGASMVTRQLLGAFREDPRLRAELLDLLR